MIICGMKGTSLIDYPGKVSAVIYTRGCNFRCPFCHNPQLVLGTDIEILDPEDILRDISERKGFIDGVVITGGEPTLHEDLDVFIKEVRGKGLSVKLDTNGYRPQMLQKLIESHLLDFISMDIKTVWGKYSKVVGVEVDVSGLKNSVDLIKQSGIDCEFRTTCVPVLVDGEDIENISRIVGSAWQYTLQQFQPVDTLSEEYVHLAPYPLEVLHDFLKIACRNAPQSRLIGI